MENNIYVIVYQFISFENNFFFYEIDPLMKCLVPQSMKIIPFESKLVNMHLKSILTPNLNEFINME